MRKHLKISILISLALASAAIPVTARQFLPGQILRAAREAYAAGDYSRSRSLAGEVLEHSGNALTRIEALDLLAHASRDVGDFADCDRFYRESLEIFESDPSLQAGDEYSNTLFNYAQFLQSMGRYQEVADLLSSLSFPAESEADARRSGLMAANLYRRNLPQDAANLLDSVLNSYTSGPSFATLLQNRGYVLDGMGRHEEAWQDLSKAAAMMQGKQKGITLANAAVALSGAGENEKALAAIDEALGLLRSSAGESDADYIIALRKKGEILHNAGLRKESAMMMKDFFNREKDRLAAVLPTLSPQMRADYWTREKPLLSKCFIIGDADPDLLMDVALARRQTSLLGTNYRGASVADADAASLHKVLSDDEAAVAFVRYDDADAITRYAAIVMPKSGKIRFVDLFAEEDIHQPLPDGGNSLYDAVTGEDPADKNKLYTDVTLADKVWHPILQAMPGGISKIHFAPEGIFHLWAIENMPFSGKENYFLTRHFSLLDMGPDSNSGDGRSAQSLVAGGLDYDLNNALPGDTTVASESEGLSDASPNDMAYSELRRNLPDNFKGRIFTYLPGTASESSEVAARMDNAILTSSLSEADFKRNAGNYRSLHLATHGYALDSGISQDLQLSTDSVGIDLSLLRSGIALTGANVLGPEGAAEDGILSAREIYDMDLGNVDLVVLSACQTAKGVISDESASGLVRALKNAGVGTVVASLWEVDDAATSLFMQAFHDAVGEGLPPEQAIEKARADISQTIREIPGRKFSAAAMASRPNGEISEVHPYAAPWYWAPFILIK